MVEGQGCRASLPCMLKKNGLPMVFRRSASLLASLLASSLGDGTNIQDTDRGSLVKLQRGITLSYFKSFQKTSRTCPEPIRTADKHGGPVPG